MCPVDQKKLRLMAKIIKEKAQSLNYADLLLITQERANEVASLFEGHTPPRLGDFKVAEIYPSRDPKLDPIKEFSLDNSVDKSLLSLQGIYGFVDDPKLRISNYSEDGRGLSRSEREDVGLAIWGLMKSGEWALFSMHYHWHRSGGQYGQAHIWVTTLERFSGPISLETIAGGCDQVLKDIFLDLSVVVRRWAVAQKRASEKLDELDQQFFLENELFGLL